MSKRANLRNFSVAKKCYAVIFLVFPPLHEREISLSPFCHVDTQIRTVSQEKKPYQFTITRQQKKMTTRLWPVTHQSLYTHAWYCIFSESCPDDDIQCKGPWKGVCVSGVNSKYCVVCSIDLEMRVSRARIKYKMSTVGLMILSVGINQN